MGKTAGRWQLGSSDPARPQGPERLREWYKFNDKKVKDIFY
jgi:hypothetical protein